MTSNDDIIGGGTTTTTTTTTITTTSTTGSLHHSNNIDGSPEYHYHNQQDYNGISGGSSSSSSVVGMQRSLYACNDWNHYTSASTTTTTTLVNKDAVLGKWRSKKRRPPLQDSTNHNSPQLFFTSPTRPSSNTSSSNNNSSTNNHDKKPITPTSTPSHLMLPSLSATKAPSTFFPCTSPPRRSTNKMMTSPSYMPSPRRPSPSINKKLSPIMPLIPPPSSPAHVFENCLYVCAHGNRNGRIEITCTHLKFVYHGPRLYNRYSSEDLPSTEFMEESYEEMMNKTIIRATKEVSRRHLQRLEDEIVVPLNKISHVYPRTYMMRDAAVELFFESLQKSIYLVSPHNRQAVLSCLIQQAPHVQMQDVPYHHWFLRKQYNKKVPTITNDWTKGLLSNYDYLLALNRMAGRTYHDISNYPIMPWVLSNYTSQTVPDLSDRNNFRDLTKPMGALDPDRLAKFLQKYNALKSSYQKKEENTPPFMYGSHYSNTGGVVLHYLVRLSPFADLHRQLQGDSFDVPDRLFRSVAQTWGKCSSTSPTEVKELTPEWYSDPTFLLNHQNYQFGSTVDGQEIGNVELPPWADNNADKFIEIMRRALESDICSAMLPDWIDLIFGHKQKGEEAEKANNLFYHLTYYEPEDLANIEDEEERNEIALHLAHFGHCPSQLFFQPHPSRHIDSVVTQSKGELRMMVSNPPPASPRRYPCTP